MSPTRFLLAGTCAGYLVARAEPRVGAFLFVALSLFAALGAVAVVRSRP
ncbi:hypothetical protein [Corallococcus sp. AB030]|nr:hypothetical protein [Corallococcus sp. AB030]